MKRIISLFLVSALLLSVFTVLPAFAAETSEFPDEPSLDVPVTTTAENDGIIESHDISPVGNAEATQAAEETQPQVTPEPTQAPVNYPVITGFEDTSGSVKISWEPFGEDNAYRVYRKTDSGWTRLTQTTETSCLVSQDAFTTSVYTIRCVDADEEFSSDFNADGWSYYYLGTPEIVYFANTIDGVRVFWKNLYEGQMRVYRRTVGGSWQRLSDGVAFDESIAYTKPTDGSQYMYFTDTTAQIGVKYIYTIRAYDSVSDQFLTDHNGGKSYTRQAITEMSGVENTENGARISWKKFDGAAKYRVYYHNERPGMRSWDLLGTDWTRLTTTTATSFTDTASDDGEIRVYTVRALDGNDDFISDFDHVGLNNLYYSAPVIQSLEPITDTDEQNQQHHSIRLTWNALNGVEYRVYRKTAGSSWARLAQVTEGTYTDEDVLPGVTYTYTIRVTDSDGNFLSDYLSGKSIFFTETPVVKTIENVENGAEITWDKVDGASYYRVYYRGENGGWNRLATQRQNSYVDTSVKDGETRVYTLRVLNEDQSVFVSDFDNDGWSNTFFAPPVIKSIESTLEGIELRWDKTEGAEDYRVYRKVGNSSWTRLGQTGDNTFLDDTAQSGTTYRYTLRMVTADGESFMSDYLSGRTIRYVNAPVIESFSNGTNGVKLTWKKSEGADYYRIYYKDGSGWSRLATQQNNEYVDTSVKGGETRTYTVRCVNASGDFESGFYEDGWSHTYFAPPEISSVAISDKGINVSWDTQDGVAYYRLYRKTLNGSWGRIMEKTSGSSYVDTTAKKDVIYAYTVRCMDADGNLISDYLDNVRYYKNGKVLSGNVFEDGTYGFRDGYLLKGLNRISGKLRYYNNQGRLYRSTVVGNDTLGYYYTDADGICCETKEMCLAAEFIAKYCKGDTIREKMKYGFLYMARNYPYVTVFNDMPKSEKDVAPFAVELFELHKGTCYRYAAAYACVTTIAGYRSRFCYGMQGNMMHGWTEVYVDGRWLVCDVDAQLPGYGYEDYAPYMMTTHMWPLNKEWYSELYVSNGVATWGKKTYF